MDKIGRNDPCPCGSGKKYKHCCLEKDRAAELAALAAKRDELQAQQAQYRAQIRDYSASIPESDDDTFTDESNAVVDLVQAGKLDEAESAARELLARYPDVHDGYDRLGMVFEARGQKRDAADCYRKVVDFIRTHPDQYESGFEEVFLELIDKLDPTPSAG